MFMGNNSREDIMDLHLNQEPLYQSNDSGIGLVTIPNDLRIETSHGCIEDRIRQLEAVIMRATWRQRRRHAPTVSEPIDTAHLERHDTGGGSAVQERIGHSGKISKMDGSRLVAKALGMDTEPKTAGNTTGNFYDCNICFDAAKNPILTCCGHLFCWSCFYQLPYVYSNTKECPECQGKVADTSIIPIYGHGNGSCAKKSNHNDSVLKVPPRPRAQRIKSMRQQILSRATPSSLIEARVQEIRNLTGALREQSRSLNFDVAHGRIERTTLLGQSHHASQVLPVTENESNQQSRSLPVSRLLRQDAEPFPTLSSALNSLMNIMERLIERLHTYNHSASRSLPQALSNNPNSGDPLSGIAATVRSEGMTPDPVGGSGITSLVPQFESSSRSMDIAIEQQESQANSATEFSRRILPSPSTRRRSYLPRRSDIDNETLQQQRSRRFG